MKEYRPYERKDQWIEDERRMHRFFPKIIVGFVSIVAVLALAVWLLWHYMC